MSAIIPAIPRLRRGHPLADRLVAYYGFYEGSGNKLHDIAGRDLHGTLTGMDPATDWVGGQNGWALDFDGSNDAVTCGAVPLFSVGSLSAFAWVRANSQTDNRNILDFGGAGNDIFELLRQGSDGKLVGRVLNSSSSAAIGRAINFTTGEWHFVGVVWNGSAVTVWLNGTVGTDASQALTGVTHASAGETFSIGKSGQTPLVAENTWDGLIGRVFIHSRALSASEIQQLYAEPDILIERPSRKVWMFGVAGGGGTTFNEGGTLSAVGTLTASHSFELVGGGDLNTVGTLTGSHTFTLAGGGSLSAMGTLSGDHGFTLAGAGTLSALGELTGDQTITLVGSGVLSARAELSGVESGAPQAPFRFRWGNWRNDERKVALHRSQMRKIWRVIKP